MSGTDRWKLITHAVREAGRLGVAELAALTGASEMTIRRDLDALARQGVLERYRGGARSLVPRGEEEPFAARAREGNEAKLRIAAETAALLADGESVVLDSGTTCVEVARALAGRRLTVMPLSLHAVNVLTERYEGGEPPATRLLLAGGEPRPGELALTGPLTESSLAALRFDTAVLGCCGLTTADGLTAYDLADAAVKRAAIASARRVVAVTEGAKLSRTALAHVAPATALHTVVTDEDAPPEEVAALTAAGVTVLTVRVAGNG
ncbi:putative DeoR family transcriptional regulator [Streptomyces sp. Tu6071]|uniref:DeoR/GlpR family DNA-binding transcription regulator n=1 Tax=Streptomyces sp. Tu6071 TaxID=355249 RepID=UPI00020E549F|nr:DeoR/GlpR family DNA-binding transcription regulator [Streptomyces sp. Tu6071]EGJ73346.1 putative DeoR family transcriptional regulator [Streptomyces sp. Tu6071]